MEKHFSDVIFAVLFGAFVAVALFAMQAQWKLHLLQAGPVVQAGTLAVPPAQKRSLEEHAHTAGGQVAEYIANKAQLVAAAPPSLQQGLMGVLISATKSFATECAQVVTEKQRTNDSGENGLAIHAAKSAHVQITAAVDACKQLVTSATPPELRQSVDQAVNALEASAKNTAAAFLCGVACVEVQKSAAVSVLGAPSQVEESEPVSAHTAASTHAVHTAMETTNLSGNAAALLAWGSGTATYLSYFASAAKQRLLNATPEHARSSVAQAIDKIGVGAKDLGVGVVIGALQQVAASTNTPPGSATAMPAGMPLEALPIPTTHGESIPTVRVSEAQELGGQLGQLLASAAKHAL